MLANGTTSDRLAKIRKAERAAHTEMYSSDQVLSINSWLQKPVKAIRDALKVFDNYDHLGY